MFLRKLKVLTYPNDEGILRSPSQAITEITKDIKLLGQQMMVVMRREKAIGLAAPQIGKLIRLIAIDTTGVETDINAFKGCMINPEVVKSDGTFTYLEGCLSVPRTGAWVTRPDDVTIRFTDLNGVTMERNFRGITSICIQHEIDHLDGILMIDKTSEILAKDKVYEK